MRHVTNLPQKVAPRGATSWVLPEAERIVLGVRGALRAKLRGVLLRAGQVPGGAALWLAICHFLVAVVATWGAVAFGFLRISSADSLLQARFSALSQGQLALAAAAIPVLLFIFGVARQEQPLPLKPNEVLIRETRIPAVLVFGLAGVAEISLDWHLWPSPVTMAKDFYCVLLTTLALVAFAYWRALGLLLRPGRMTVSAFHLLSQKANDALVALAQQTIARGLVRLRLEGTDVVLDRPDREVHRYQQLDASAPGVVTDIHLGEILDLFENIKAATAEKATTTPDGDSASVPNLTHPQPVKIHLAASIGDRVGQSNKALLYLPRGTYLQTALRNWEARLNRFVRLAQDQDREDPVVALTDEMAALGDDLVSDLRRGHLHAVDQSLRVLAHTVFGFGRKRRDLETAGRRFLGALQESVTVATATELIPLWDLLRRLLTETLESRSAAALKLVYPYPARVAWWALDEGALDSFQEAVEWMPRFYRLAIPSVPAWLSDYTVDHAWRLLYETVRFRALAELDTTIHEDDIARNRECVVAATVAAARLLKEAYDAKRPQDFAKFSTALERLRKTLLGRDWLPEAALGEDDGRLPARPGPEDLHTDGPGYSRALAAEYLRQAFLGIDAWMCHQFDEGILSKEDFLTLRSAVRLPHSVAGLWRLGLTAIESDAERRLGWDWWVDEEHEEGRAYWGDFSGYLLLAVCLRSIESIIKVGEKPSANDVIPTHPRLVAAEGGPSSILLQLLTRIERDQEKWIQILGPSVPKALQILKAQLASAAARQRELDIREVAGAPLSNPRIAAVKKEIIESWRKSAVLRSIFASHGGKIVLDDDSAPAVRVIGYNVLEPRGAYIDQPGISYPNWGEHIGEGLGVSETLLVFSQLAASAREAGVASLSGDDFLSKLEATLGDQKQNGYEPTIVLADPPWWALEVLGSRLRSQPAVEARKDPRWYWGDFAERPVVRIHTGQKSQVLIADFSRTARWRQLKPQRIAPTEEMISPEILFGIKEISDEVARELLAKQPELAPNGATLDNAITYVRTKVAIRVVEKFEFTVVDPRGLCLFSFADLP